MREIWSHAERTQNAYTLSLAVHKIHGESKKTRHLTLAHNFTKYLPIFKILSLLDSAENL